MGDSGASPTDGGGSSTSASADAFGTPLQTKNTFVHFGEQPQDVGPMPGMLTAPAAFLSSFFSRAQDEDAEAPASGGLGLRPGASDAETEAPSAASPSRTAGVTALSSTDEEEEPSSTGMSRHQQQPLLLPGQQGGMPPGPPQSPRGPGLAAIPEADAGGLSPPPPPQSPPPEELKLLAECPSLPPPPLSSPTGAGASAMRITPISLSAAVGEGRSPPGPPQSPKGEASPPGPPQSPTGACALPLEVGLDPSLPSVGSALHSTGNCCPCAWFHKEQGCMNDKGCTRCHLCPPGEVKARKKAAKEATLKKEKDRRVLEEPAYVSVSPLAVKADLVSLCQAVPQKNTFVHYSDPEVKQFSAPPAFSAPGVFWRQAMHSSESLEVPIEETSPGNSLSPSSPQKSIPEGNDLASLHARGECKPCSYFWYKEDGCRNSDTCTFCHLCEKGESKKRKKERIRALKAAGQFQQS